MTPGELIAAFETLADAPDGVKRLRELVLQLAVRGKLVPQDSADVPASELLNRKSGESREQTPRQRSVNDVRHPDTAIARFELPSTWIWSTVEGCTSYLRRGKSPEYDDSGATPVVSQKCVQWSGFDISRARSISAASLTRYEEEQFLREGDLLWNSTGLGTLGRVIEFRADLAYTKVVADSHVTIVRPFACAPRYLWYWLAGPEIQEVINDIATGSTKQTELATRTIASLPVPVPPLAEQRRIVARVDELMGLLDRLEAARNARDEVHRAARDAALAALHGAENAEAVEVAWTRVSGQMDALFTHPEDVTPLRQAILQLAIRGRLVPQNPDDEPAIDLLRQIADGRSAEEPAGSPSTRLADEAPLPYVLPEGWSWCRLADVGELARGRSRYRPRNDPSLYSGGTIPMIQTGDVARARGIIRTYTALYNQAGLEQSRLWPTGTLCITIAANIADVALLGFDACFPDSVVGFLPAAPIRDARFFEIFMRTIQASLESYAPATAQKNINLSILNDIWVPLPPLREIEAIVAKVDAMMILCDQLEARLTASRELQAQFAAAAVHHLEV